MSLAMVFAFVPASIRAAVISYDGAAYTATTSIAGLNGGTGWSNAWSGANNVVSGGLAFGGLSVVSNRFTTDGNNVGSFRTPATNAFAGLLSGGKWGKEGTTLWLGFLLRRDISQANSYVGVSLFDGAAEELFIGMPFNAAQWGIHAWDLGNPGGISLSTSNILNNVTAFLVVRLRFGTSGATDTVDLFVNPAPGFEPTTPAVTRAGADIHFNQLRFQSGNGALTASFDEIRLGETFADVAPLGLSIADVSVAEAIAGETPAILSVTLSATNSMIVRVAYATSDGSAKAGEDYIATNGVLEFLPGVRNLQVVVPIKPDSNADGGETLTVTLSDPEGAVLSRAKATITIHDPPPPLLVYEGFEYAPTTIFNGFNGGTGWLSGWTGVFDVMAGGLTMEGLVTWGNRLAFGSNDVASALRANRQINAAAYPTLTGPSGGFGLAGTEIWFSCLLRRDSGTPNASLFGVALNTETDTPSVFFGQAGGQTNWGFQKGFFNSPSPGESAPSVVPVLNGETVLLLARLAFTASYFGSVELWVNPVPGGTLGPPQAALTNSFHRIASVSVERDNASGSWDEIRLGTSYAAVAPGSRPVLKSLILAGANFSFSFQTLVGRSYSVEVKTNLAAGFWQVFTNLTGDGSLRQIAAPISENSQSFFRLRQP